jgi:hypothetical protein
MRSEANEDDVSPRLLREAKDFVQGLRAKLDAMPLKDQSHQQQALRFLTACASLLDLLEKPNIRPALLELKKVQDTTVGNLLGFMHAYNLRSGAATAPEQRQAYHQLFATLDRTRDQILAEAKLGPTAPGTADPKAAIDFFQDLDRIRSSKGATPKRPPTRGSR